MPSSLKRIVLGRGCGIRWLSLRFPMVRYESEDLVMTTKSPHSNGHIRSIRVLLIPRNLASRPGWVERRKKISIFKCLSKYDHTEPYYKWLAELEKKNSSFDSWTFEHLPHSLACQLHRIRPCTTAVHHGVGNDVRRHVVRLRTYQDTLSWTTTKEAPPTVWESKFNSGIPIMNAIFKGVRYTSRFLLILQ